MKLLPYSTAPAEHLEWDARCQDVAALLIDQIRSVLAAGSAKHSNDYPVEHVGSSSVPDMPGKNVVDLAMLVPPADIPSLVEGLVASGWQRQTEPWAHPAERPMLRASVEHDGQHWRTHLHLLPEGSGEWEITIGFRELLRSGPDLRERYAARKREVLAEGITPSHLYANAKSDVVLQILREGGYNV